MSQDIQSRSVAAAEPSPIIASPAPRPLRIWPAVAMLAAFWAFLYANYNLELAMFSRFMSRIIAYGLLLLAFLAWWLTRRQIPLRDRMFAVGIVTLVTLIAGFLSDKSVGPLALFMTALPFIFTAWTMWILVARSFSPRIQRLGFCATIAATVGFFGLLRWEGLYGNQIPEFEWRWRPTAEERFLAAHAAESATNSPDRPTIPPRAWTLQPGDWPEFRGANRDGVLHGLPIKTDWTGSPPKLIWKRLVGPAWSSMIVVDGFLVTQEQRDEREAIVCYDAATGSEVWEHAEPERFFEALAGAGPRATPTFADGRIYAMGAKGRLTCLATSDGKQIWSRDVVKEAGAAAPQWGYSTSPLVVDGKVITFAGGEGNRSLMAYDAKSGDLVWQRPGGTFTYSSPQLLTIDGRRQIVIDDNRALRGVNPDNGEVLWERATVSEMAMPMLQPLLLAGSQLVVAAEPGVVLLQLKQDTKAWSVAERWSSNRLKPAFNDYVVHRDHVFGLDDGILTCVSLADGQRVWKRGRYGHGQMLLLAEKGMLLVLSEQGEVALVAATPSAYEELGRFKAIDGKTWNHPVIANGKLYVRNAEEMACFELKLADTP